MHESFGGLLSDHCYAASMTRRLEAMGRPEYAGLVHNGHFNGTVRTLEDRLADPLHWRKPSRVFVNSMSDLFHLGVPFEFLDKVSAVMALCQEHEFQVLTKRPERMAGYFENLTHRSKQWCKASLRGTTPIWSVVPRWRLNRIYDERAEKGLDPDETGKDDIVYDQIDSETDSGARPLRNVWLGTSIEDQATADRRIPHLLRCRAAVRFLSVEPMLGEIVFRPWIEYAPALFRTGADHNPIHWLIVGCESGAKRRPCRWEWMESVVEQCRAAAVPVFVKQLAERSDGTGKVYRHEPGEPWPEWVPRELRVQEWPDKRGNDV